MAITARTILTQPAATAVAAITLLGLTALGSGAFSSLQHERMSTVHPCDRPIVEQNEGLWSEADWISYVSCYESQRDSARVVGAAGLALEYQPQSEVLWNAKSIHQILNNDHRGAVSTLRTAMTRVEPTTGTMENNLAWAGFWTSMDLDEQRTLYRSALAKTPMSCEILHTGLFTEYKQAQSEDRYKRFWSLKKYKELRQRYANQRCEERVRYGNWETLAEVGGLGMIDEEVEKLVGRADAKANPTLYNTVETLRRHHLGRPVADFCNTAFPPSHRDIDCEDYFEETRDEIRGFATVERTQKPRTGGCVLKY